MEAVQVFEDLESFAQAQLSCGLALGVFDGVHLGHQAVIDGARGFGRVGVLIFDPHPVEVLAPERTPRRIIAGLEHQKKILAELGVSFMVVMNFTKEFAARESGDFAEELLGTGVRQLSAGEDWSFGKRGAGNMSLLAELAEGFEVGVTAVAAVTQKGGRISSTQIRKCLNEGDLAGAATMLGRPYSVYGKVLQGRQLGRKIGFATANVEVAEEQLVENGVYLVEGNGIRGVANIGTRPTVNDSLHRSLEVHLFSEEIPMEYGWDLEVSFLEKIREEKRFDGVDDLKAQIAKDVAYAKGV